jgi:hypothetical protein
MSKYVGRASARPRHERHLVLPSFFVHPSCTHFLSIPAILGHNMPFEPPGISFELSLTLVSSGDFHTPPKKTSFFQCFSLFFLAFSFALRYSPLRPDSFRLHQV